MDEQAPETVYNYWDESERLIYQTTLDPTGKRRFRLPDKPNEWKDMNAFPVETVQSVPYGLLDLLAKPDNPIFVVRSEAASDPLCAADLVAVYTANPNDLIPFIVQRKVVAVNEGGDIGKWFSAMVAETVHDACESVKIVELPGWDILGTSIPEWLAGDHTPAELLGLADIAPEWKPGPSKPEQKPQIRFVDAVELMKDNPPEPVPIVERFLFPDTVALMGGAPKVGKSYLALEFSVAVALGRLALGTLKTTPGKVAYIALEDSPLDMARRLLKIEDAGKLERGQLIVFTGQSIDLSRDVPILTTFLEGKSLIVIDSLRRAHRLEEDKSADSARISAFLRQLSRATGATILAIHHLTKAWESDADIFSRLRGSGDLFAEADTAIIIEQERGEGWVGVQAVHRVAPEPLPLCIRRVHNPEDTAITWELQAGELQSVIKEKRDIETENQITSLLRLNRAGLITRQVLEKCPGRTAAVHRKLKSLVEQGIIRTSKAPMGTGILYTLADDMQEEENKNG